MKAITSVFVLVFALVASSAFASPVERRASVKNASVSHQNRFAFKVDRKFKRALIEVFQSNGELVAVTAISKRKMVIDFGDVKSGTYTIRVKKNNQVEEFHFEKK